MLAPFVSDYRLVLLSRLDFPLFFIWISTHKPCSLQSLPSPFYRVSMLVVVFLWYSVTLFNRTFYPIYDFNGICTRNNRTRVIGSVITFFRRRCSGTGSVSFLSFSVTVGWCSSLPLVIALSIRSITVSLQPMSFSTLVVLSIVYFVGERISL